MPKLDIGRLTYIIPVGIRWMGVWWGVVVDITP
jgi:hypothetical protein